MNMLTKYQIELIHREVDGENTPEASAEVQQLVATQPEALTLMTNLQSLDALFRQVPEREPSPAVRQAINKALLSPRPEQAQGATQSITRWAVQQWNGISNFMEELMLTKKVLLVATTAVAVIAIVGNALVGYPPSIFDAGTIGAGKDISGVQQAGRYHGAKKTEADVTLTNPEIVTLLQNDQVLKLVKSEAFRETMHNDAFLKLMSSEAFMRLLRDNSFQQLMSSEAFMRLQRDNSFQQLMSSEAFVRIMRDNAFQKLMSSDANRMAAASEANRMAASSDANRMAALSEANRALAATPAYRELSANEAYRAVLSSEAFRAVASNAAFREVMANEAYRTVLANEANREVFMSPAYRELAANEAYRNVMSSEAFRVLASSEAFRMVARDQSLSEAFLNEANRMQ
jgi:hypothetical protein